MKLLLLGLLTGIDNFAVSSGLGVYPLSKAQRRLLMLAFGLCEGGMPLLGLALAANTKAPFARFPDPAPWLLFLTGVLSLAGGWYYANAVQRRSESATARGAPQTAQSLPRAGARFGWFLVLLPLGLSFDNLAAGAALAGTALPPVVAALFVGAASMALCGLGLLVGDGMAKRLNLSRSWIAGVWLLVCGLFSLTG